MTRVLPLLACVDPAERALAARAAGRLTAALGTADPARPWRVALRLADPGPPAGPVDAVVYVSLRPLLADPPEPGDPDGPGPRAADWAPRLAALAPAALVGTVPRGRGPAGPGDPDPGPRTARIRALNVLAVRWSASLGVGVVDFDRALSRGGAGPDWLATDGGLTRGAYALAAAVLGADLDDRIPPAVAEAARAALGKAP